MRRTSGFKRTWLLVALAGLAITAPVAVMRAQALLDNQEAVLAGQREFGGAHRYETSLLLADGFVSRVRSAGGRVDTALVASGESLIDAVVGAAVSNHKQAPVLLTRTAELFIPAAHFIERQGISNIIILGNEQAVSAQVANQLSTIAGVQRVERIGGADRFETAALLANLVGASVGYCGRPSSAAIVVLGEGNVFADAVMVGPLSYTLQTPMILADKRGLPEISKSALRDLGVSRVLLVGQANTPAVRLAIGGAGVSHIDIVAGANTFETAIGVLDETRECLGGGFSSNTLAFASKGALSDGISSSAALLGIGLGAFGETTPLLLVERNTLPEAVRDWLQAECRNLKITAIGGDDIVSPNVMTEAVSVANSVPGCDPYVSIQHCVPADDDHTKTDGHSSAQAHDNFCTHTHLPPTTTTADSPKGAPGEGGDEKDSIGDGDGGSSDDSDDSDDGSDGGNDDDNDDDDDGGGGGGNGGSGKPDTDSPDVAATTTPDRDVEQDDDENSKDDDNGQGGSTTTSTPGRTNPDVDVPPSTTLPEKSETPLTTVPKTIAEKLPPQPLLDSFCFLGGPSPSDEQKQLWEAATPATQFLVRTIFLETFTQITEYPSEVLARSEGFDGKAANELFMKLHKAQVCTG